MIPPSKRDPGDWLMEEFLNAEDHLEQEQGILGSRNPPDIFEAVRDAMNPPEPDRDPSKEKEP